jgi:uncharacterized protein involved in outer membrane biogenesis
MSRKARIRLIIIAIPVVLVIAGIVVLKVVFTSERLKSMVVPRMEEATGRPVAINDISLSVFPSIALKVEGVSMANRRGEGFSSAPFLTLDGLRLNVKLLPLLKSRIEVTSLEIDRPHLLIEVNARNETNYGDLTAGKGAAGSAVSPADLKNPVPSGSAGSTAQGAAGSAVSPDLKNPVPSGSPGSTAQGAAEPPPVSAAAFLISNMQVNNGSVDYVSHKDNSATRVRNLFLATEVGEEGNSIVVTGNAATDSLSYGSVETPLLAGLRLRLDYRMSYDLSKDILKIEKGDMVLQDMCLVLAGSVSRIRLNPVLEITVGSDSLNIADLFSLVPGEYMEKAKGVKGTGIAQVSIAVTGTLTDSTSVDLAGTVTAREAGIRYPQLPKPITDITILSSFTRTKTIQEFRVEDLSANLGGAPVRMAMTVTNFDNPYLDLSAGGSLNLATVAEYYPLEKGTELGGEMILDLRIAGKVANPKAMQASGSMTFLNVSAKTATSANPVRKLNGTLAFNNEIVETKKLSLVMGESDLTVACRVKNYLSLVSKDKKAPQSTATVTLQSKHIFTRDLMSEPQAPAAGGREAGGVQTDGGKPESRESGQQVPAKTAKTGGKSTFALPDLDLDMRAEIGTLTLEKFELTNVRGSMLISKGVVTMQNLTLSAFGGSVVSSGSLNLNRPDRPLFDLNLNMNALEASLLLSSFTSFGRYLSGALTMNTSLKGALNDTLGLIPDGLEGNGKVGIKNGSLKGFKVNQSLARQLNLPDLETIQFKDWGNDFTVHNGRLVIKDLTINALNAQYVVNGSQGLDGTLDYRMALYLHESVGEKLKISGFAGEAMNLFKDQSGRYQLEFNVGGTTDDPKVQLDTDPVRKRAEELAKQKLEGELKKVEGSLKQKAGDALKKLFKKDKK